VVESSRISILEPGALERATEELCQGAVIAFPTDTVYGVGAHGFLEEAVSQLYRVKKRPVALPIPLLLPDAGQMEAVCIDIPAVTWQIAERFWPGGLSLVLRRSEAVPDAVTARGPTVAVRVPDHPLVQELCRRIQAPLAATSANLHGQPPPLTAGEVQPMLGQQIALLLDGGACRGGMASTVLDLSVWPPAILRAGPVKAEQLAGIVPLASIERSD
jgi:L-threonylcarbamoyladenylate synthase